MKIDTSESFLIESGRIFEILGRAYSIGVDCQAFTFCKMFNTLNYRRKLKHEYLLFARAHLLIERELARNSLKWKQWKIVRRGSNNYHDIITCRNQYYQVIRLK